VNKSGPATVLDQEIVVHLFASPTGPDATAADEAIRTIWLRCRDILRMRDPIAHLDIPDQLPDRWLASVAAGETVLAARQARTGVWQAVLRNHHDVLTLSAVLAPSSGTRPDPEIGWKRLDNRWNEIVDEKSNSFMGGVRIYQGIAPSSDAAVDKRFAELLRPALPVRGIADEWRTGAATPSGLGIWEVGEESSGDRRLLILAPPGRARLLSAWTWSRGDANLPPLARCLRHGALIRYQDRVHADAAVRILTLDAMASTRRVEALADGELTAATLTRHLLGIRRSVATAHSNIRLVLGADADALLTGPGPLAGDVRLASGLLAQIELDLAHLAEITDHLRALRRVLGRIGPSATAPRTHPTSPRPDQGRAKVPNTRDVFVIHGRDIPVVEAFWQFFQALDLHPLDWEEVVSSTQSATPFLGDAVRAAFDDIQAAIVLLTPDDIVHLHPDLRDPADPDYESRPTGQARPNVLFEAGMAFGLYPKRTIMIEVGRLRPFADVSGRNVVRFDGSVVALQKIVQRLKNAGCAVNDSGTGWLDIRRFANLAAFSRHP
jgi:hypothetical protein